MELGTAQHEIGARRTGIGAIEQQMDMVRPGVLPAHLQAMHGCLNTDIVAVGAVGDAFSHLVADLVLMLHDGPFNVCWSPQFGR
ncbi:MAG: hypothetical protein ACR2OU_00055 [Thermomicrobiales bacterium]